MMLDGGSSIEYPQNRLKKRGVDEKSLFNSPDIQAIFARATTGGVAKKVTDTRSQIGAATRTTEK